MTHPRPDGEQEFDIPDEALVVRFGNGTRAQYGSNCHRTLATPRWGFSAFSVRAAVGLSAEEIHDHPPPPPWNEWTTTTGLQLREAGLQSRKTGNDRLHYSILCPDGVTDHVWDILREIFR